MNTDIDTNTALPRVSTSVEQPFADTLYKGARDVLVLRYMARRVLTMIQRPDEVFVSPTMQQPLLYLLQERHNRTHRIALYQPLEYFLLPNILFVGFISKKQASLSPEVVTEIVEVDKKMLRELTTTPGLLSYSSLQFRNGNWCNLVLFRDETAKVHLRGSETHSYASYQLAPRYYEWIRLHNGRVEGGLAQGQLILKKTHLYMFPIPHGKPTIQELIY